MITECCTCRNWRDKENPRIWYTPSVQERRDYYFKDGKKLSHSYCPPCNILNLERDGFTGDELIELIKEVESDGHMNIGSKL